MSLRPSARILLAALMVGAGIAHFVRADLFMRIVPDGLPRPDVLVWVSGFFEVLGGLGLVVPRTRRFSAVGLIALYIAVFPANVSMALHPAQFPEIPAFALWLRLPFQAVFIAWAWWVGGDGPTTARERGLPPR